MSSAKDCRDAPPHWSADPDPRRTRLVRTLVVVDVVLALWYFGWLLQPGRVGTAWVYALLVVAEVFNLVLAIGFWWTVSPAVIRLPADPPEPGLAVDVLIPTYDEDREIIEPTIQAAGRLRGANVKVWVLDDGHREWVQQLARQHGVEYLTRPTNEGAKAGNINHALAYANSPYLAVFDCDHVPDPRFLEQTLGRFADPKVAFVQTPQYYANAPDNSLAAAAWAQQALFFGPIGRGKDAHDTMFCCGTNFVMRREALDAAGGFPTDSVTEDFLLSVMLVEKGWTSVYEPQVLASGLAPEDLAGYVSQQRRWARGCLGVIPTILRAKTPLRFKASSLMSAMYFLSGWAILLNMLWPVIWAVTGHQPLATVSASQFLLHFAPFFVVTLFTLSAAADGKYTWAGYSLAVSNFWIHISSTFAAVLGRQRSFVVTPKHGRPGWQPKAAAPALIAAATLSLAAVFGLAFRGVTAAGVNNVAFATLHVTVLLTGARYGLRLTRATRTADAPVEEPVTSITPWQRLDLAIRDAEMAIDAAILAPALRPGRRAPARHLVVVREPAEVPIAS